MDSDDVSQLQSDMIEAVEILFIISGCMVSVKNPVEQKAEGTKQPVLKYSEPVENIRAVISQLDSKTQGSLIGRLTSSTHQVKLFASEASIRAGAIITRADNNKEYVAQGDPDVILGVIGVHVKEKPN